MKNMKEGKSGITLIALVVTIIVLLILAGISIAMLSGNNGVLIKAGEAKNISERESVIEQAKTDVLSYQVENKSGNLSKTQLKSVLEKYFKDVPENLPEGDELLKLQLTTLDKYGKHTIKVSDIFIGNINNNQDSNLDLLKSFLIGKNRRQELWNLGDSYGGAINPISIEQKDLFIVGVSNIKDYILYDEKIYEVSFSDGSTADSWITDVNVANTDKNIHELGWHEGVLTTAEGEYIFENHSIQYKVQYRDIDRIGWYEGWHFYYDNNGIAIWCLSDEEFQV